MGLSRSFNALVLLAAFGFVAAVVMGYLP